MTTGITMTVPAAIMEIARIGTALSPELWTAMVQGSPSGYRKALLAVSLQWLLEEPGESGRVADTLY